MYIRCGWPRRIGIRCGSTIGGHGLWGFNYLDVDAGSEWLKMGYDKLLIRWWSGCRQKLCKLGEAESCQHSCEIGVMGKVKVEGLV